MSYRLFDKESWKKSLGPFLHNQSRPFDQNSKHAAVALILSKVNGHWSLLFMERAIHPLDPWSGDVSLPGGRYDSRDQNFQQTAARELVEELGVSVEDDDLIGSLVGFLAPGFDTYIHPSVWALDGKIEFDLDPKEAQSVFWLPLDYLFDPRSIRYKFFNTRRSSRYLPFLPFEKFTIWGLTFGVLTQFVEEIYGASLVGHKTWPFYFSQTSN